MTEGFGSPKIEQRRVFFSSHITIYDVRHMVIQYAFRTWGLSLQNASIPIIPEKTIQKYSSCIVFSVIKAENSDMVQQFSAFKPEIPTVEFLFCFDKMDIEKAARNQPFVYHGKEI